MYCSEISYIANPIYYSMKCKGSFFTPYRSPFHAAGPNKLDCSTYYSTAKMCN